MWLKDLIKRDKSDETDKYQRKVQNIDFCGKNMIVDGQALTFPLALSDIEAVFGQCEKRDIDYNNGDIHTHYIYHNDGIVFCTVNPIFLKKCKAYLDDDHIIQCVFMHFGDGAKPKSKGYNAQEVLPKRTCKAKLTFEGRPLSFRFAMCDIENWQAHYWNDYVDTSNLQTSDETFFLDDSGNPNSKVSISFEPERPKVPTSYKLKTPNEPVLEFDNLNFKLAVLQVLIYDKELLEPYFDVYDFSDQYRGELDLESCTPLKPVLNFFKKLAIPARLAECVEEIDMDGGNEIYMQIAPGWDGEDDVFEVNKVSLAEVTQLPKLKKVTLMSTEFDSVAAVFRQAGVKDVN